MKNDQFSDLQASSESVILPYRNRIIYTLAVVSLVIFVPFVINNFFQGRDALSVFLLTFVAILTVDAWSAYRGRPSPIPLWVLVFPVLGGFLFSMLERHYIGLAWAYPVVVLFFFILPRRTALLLVTLIVVCLAAMTLAMLDWAYATRIIASLATVAVCANFAVSIIEGLHRQLLAQATIDPLTGAYNRRQMDMALNAACGRTIRGAAQPALMVIDVDHFKSINDRFGHAAGDEVLKAIVATIRSRMRIMDNLFRSGGEEFVLLLPDTPMAGAIIVAENLRDRIEQSRFHGDVQVTVSIGVSSLQAGDTVATWLLRGDTALYLAKTSGRNRVVCGDGQPAVRRPTT